MRIKYYRSFRNKYLDKLIESYKASDYVGKRQIKNYVYGNIRLTENEKDRIWRDIVN